MSVANKLLSSFDIASVITCKRDLVPQLARPSKWLEEDSLFLENHLKQLVNDEVILIGDHHYSKFNNNIKLKKIPLLTVRNRTELNSNILLEALEKQDVFYDAIVVYGSWIIEERLHEWLKRRNCKFLNIHGGISPFYRGSSTLLWPLVLSQPELMGFTIHELDNKIDHGPIYKYIFPTLSIGMKPTEMMAACQLALLEKISKSILECIKFNSIGVLQSGYGKTFLEKDYRPNCLKSIYDQYRNNLYDLDKETLIKRRKGYLGKFYSLV